MQISQQNLPRIGSTTATTKRQQHHQQQILGCVSAFHWILLTLTFVGFLINQLWYYNNNNNHFERWMMVNGGNYDKSDDRMERRSTEKYYDNDAPIYHQEREQQPQVVVYNNNNNKNVTDTSSIKTNNKNKRVLFLISMGKDASNSNIVERCLLSIRRRGNYTNNENEGSGNYVVLLTDANETRYSKLQQDDPYFLVVKPQLEHYNIKSKKDMSYKRFKTYILDYVDSEPKLKDVNLIYYFDIDIVVGAPLDTFFEYIEKKYSIGYNSFSSNDDEGGNDKIDEMKDQNQQYLRASTSSSSLPFSWFTKQRQQASDNQDMSSSHIYFFKGNFDFVPVQGGQFVIDRYKSRGCLTKWRNLIDSTPKETKDQYFLKLMLEEQQQQREQGRRGREDMTTTNDNSSNIQCQLHLMDQEPHLHFPNMLSMVDMIERYKESNKRRETTTETTFTSTTNVNTNTNSTIIKSSVSFPTLLHIKNTGDATTIPGPLQEQFFNMVLDLSEEEKQTTRLGKRTVINSDPYWRNKVQYKNRNNNQVQ